jgi:hypothetical protein
LHLPQWSALETVSTHWPPQHVGPGLPGARQTAADFLEQVRMGDSELVRNLLLLTGSAAWLTTMAGAITMAIAIIRYTAKFLMMLLVYVLLSLLLLLRKRIEGGEEGGQLEFVCICIVLYLWEALNIYIGETTQ